MSAKESKKENQSKFYPPDVETEGGDAICPNCNEEFPVDEAVTTMDNLIKTESGAVARVFRRYVCSEDCMMELAGFADE